MLCLFRNEDALLRDLSNSRRQLLHKLALVSKLVVLGRQRLLWQAKLLVKYKHPELFILDVSRAQSKIFCRGRTYIIAARGSDHHQPTLKVAGTMLLGMSCTWRL